MALFQLDPQSVADRARASGRAARVPGIIESVWRGALGFMTVGVVGFAPWAIFEKWFRSMRETQLYVACTLAFIAASGPFLHRLIIGPGSLPRFYKVFAMAFTAYAAAWIACWVAMRGSTGEVFGLLAGASAMGLVIAGAFGAMHSVLAIVLALVAGTGLGYYAGDWFYQNNSHDHRYLAMTIWGLLYGTGFGAGLGIALYLSQSETRRHLRAMNAAAVMGHQNANASGSGT
jgi:hypothetical protein